MNRATKLAVIIAAAVAGSCAGLAQTGAPAEPVTGSQRLSWAVEKTIGPASMLGGIVSAGWGTLLNTPHEYGTHWEGFGDRYGMRLTGISASNAMEASLGAIWHEDPRYWRKGEDAPFRQRIGQIFKYAFFALDENGEARPAYARYVAYAGNNFLSNTWRQPSEADSAHALERTATAFLGRIASNAWDEFWPDVKHKVFRHGNTQGTH